MLGTGQARYSTTNAPKINPKVFTPANLRAFLARHDITKAEVARRRGVTQEAVNHAVRADITGRHVSHALLENIWQIANQILLEREVAV